MPRTFHTVRELIYWEYSKLVSEKAVGNRTNYKFANYTFQKFRDGRISPSSILSENQQLFKAGDVCAYCGATQHLQWEHIIPVAAGGPDIFDNMVRARAPCNQKKGAKNPYQWFRTDQLNAIPRIVLGKFLKLVFDAYDRAGVIDSSEYMKLHCIERVTLGRIFEDSSVDVNQSMV